MDKLTCGSVASCLSQRPLLSGLGQYALLLQLACSSLSVCVDDMKMRAGDKRDLVEKEGATSPFHSRIPLAADPACHPLTFSIVLTDREPGTGYVATSSKPQSL